MRTFGKWLAIFGFVVFVLQMILVAFTDISLDVAWPVRIVSGVMFVGGCALFALAPAPKRKLIN